MKSSNEQRHSTIFLIQIPGTNNPPYSDQDCQWPQEYQMGICLPTFHKVELLGPTLNNYVVRIISMILIISYQSTENP